MVPSATLQKLAPNPFPRIRKSNTAFWNSTKTRSKFASRAPEKVACQRKAASLKHGPCARMVLVLVVLVVLVVFSSGALPLADGRGRRFVYYIQYKYIYVYNMYSWFYRSVSLWGLDALLIAIGPDASFSRANEARTSGARGWVSIVIISFFTVVYYCVFFIVSYYQS